MQIVYTKRTFLYEQASTAPKMNINMIPA